MTDELPRLKHIQSQHIPDSVMLKGILKGIQLEGTGIRPTDGAIFHDSEGNPLSALQASSIYEGRSPPTSTTPPPQPVEPRYPRRVETRTWKVEEEMSPQAGLSNSPQSYQEVSAPQMPGAMAPAPTPRSFNEGIASRKDDSDEEYDAQTLGRVSPMFGGVTGRMEEDESGPENPAPPWAPLPPGQQIPVARFDEAGEEETEEEAVQRFRQAFRRKADEEEAHRLSEAETPPQTSQPLLGLQEHEALRDAETRQPILGEEETIEATDMNLRKPTGLGLGDEDDDAPMLPQMLQPPAQPAITPTYGQMRSGNPPGKIPASPGRSGSSGVYRLSGSTPFRKSFANVFQIPNTTYTTELLKSADGKSYFIQGYASSTDKDRDGDQFSMAAISDMAQQAPGLNVFDNHIHDNDHMLGTITNAQVMNNKLWIEAKLKDPEVSPRTRDIIEAVKSGLNLSWSVGGDLSESHMEGDTRVLDKCELYECSIAPLPSNPAAVVTGLEFKNKRLF